MADIIITPASSIMAFTSSLSYKQTLTQDASGSLTLYGSGSTGRTDIFSVDGTNGRLFSVSDDLSDSLFSVNTIAGLPVIEAFANNKVTIGTYNSPGIIVNGTTASITGSLQGTATSAATWTTGRTLTIGSTGKSVNGSGDVAWSLSEIGAATAAQGAKADTAHGWGNHASAGYLTSVTNISGNAATATLASTLTIGYNNNSNSTYQMLWGSGDGVYGTAGVYLNPSTDYVYATSYQASDWFRSTGVSGWYNESYTGGIYQTESTYVRVYNNKGFYIDGGTSDTANDATLYVTATNNNDWLAIFNAYNSSKTEYGMYVRIGASATYGYALSTDGSGFSYRVDGSGQVFSPKYYDINDTSYYLDPASSGISLNVRGEIQNPSIWINDGDNNNNYNENIRLFNAPNGVSVIAFGSSGTGGIPQSSLLGFSDRLEIRVGANGQTVQRNYDNYVEAIGSFRAPIFYDSADTNYSWNPNTTSAHRFTTPSGYVDIGPMNSGYSHFQTDRPDFYFNKGVHVDGELTIYGTSVYLDSTRIQAPIFYDSNDTNYYLNPNGTSILGNVRAENHSTLAGDGRGYGFWNGYGGSAYSIWMSESGNGTYGGQVSGVASNNDYNMYFKMTSNNRGFVFITGDSTPTLQIANEGIHVDGDIYASKFYDRDDTSYYVDPKNVSTFREVQTRAATVGAITAPDPSAVLDVQSTIQGFLLPRMSESERDSIGSPAIGLMIFNLDQELINVFAQGNWQKVPYI